MTVDGDSAFVTMQVEQLTHAADGRAKFAFELTAVLTATSLNNRQPWRTSVSRYVASAIVGRRQRMPTIKR
jgi:hypothetical protein